MIKGIVKREIKAMINTVIKLFSNLVTKTTK